jgi:hypothetical protein
MNGQARHFPALVMLTPCAFRLRPYHPAYWRCDALARLFATRTDDRAPASVPHCSAT